jgi:hypothetical protein
MVERQAIRVLIFGVVLLLLASAGTAPSAVELLVRMQDSLGGGDKLASVVDLEQRVSAELWNDRGWYLGRVVKRVRWIKPDLLRVDQIGPGDTYVLFFDGTSGWEILPGERSRGAIPLVGDELRFAHKTLRDFQMKVWLADRDRQYVLTSPAAHIVRIADQASPGDPTHQLELRLDPQSARPITMRTLTPITATRTVWGETRIHEWQTIAGVQFPRRFEAFLNGARLADLTLEDTRVNSGLSPTELAARPADLRPVIDRSDVHP